MFNKILELLDKSHPIDVDKIFEIIEQNPEDTQALINSLNQSFGREGLIFVDNLLKLADKDYLGNRTILYHGSPEIIDKFKLTKGKRSGFLGSTHEVDNLGIFLTDSKRLANYFGENRSNYKAYRVYTVGVELGKILDMSKSTNIPMSARKIAVGLIEDYDGQRYPTSRIPRSYQWWLLDKPEFVEELKKYFDTIKYQEEFNILKEAGDTKAYTYFVFDPDRIRIAKKGIIKANAPDIFANREYLRELAEREKI